MTIYDYYTKNMIRFLFTHLIVDASHQVIPMYNSENDSHNMTHLFVYITFIGTCRYHKHTTQ